MRIRQLSLPGEAGEIFLHSMPGKCEDIAEFSEEIRKLSIHLVVCLAECEEIRRKSPAYAELRAKKGLPCDIRDLPIPDFGVPADRDAFRRLALEIARLVRDGRRLLIHCAGGVGRTGTFANCVLLAMHHDPEEARRRVEEAGSRPETEEQRELVRWFAGEMAESG